MEAHAPSLRPLAAVIAAAWALAIGVWTAGADAPLHHDALLAGGVSLGALAVFVVVWQVHVAAVMLPSSLPMLGRFAVVVRTRPRARTLRMLFLAGYLAVWTAFAIVALSADGVLHTAADRWTWIGARTDLVLGVTLAGAGAFQFSSLKRRCLHACRRPDTFLRLHYRRGGRAAAVLGVRHGMFCVGCCWAMMLVMVALGVGNLALMAPLAALMAAEKTVRRGALLVRPAGWAMIASGALVALLR